MDKELLEILTLSRRNDFQLFCKYFSKHNFSTDDLVHRLLFNSKLKNQYRPIKKLAWFFNVELQGRFIGEDFHFHISKLSESFQLYLYSWDRLGRKKVPFDKWSDLAEEGIILLKDLVGENKLEKYKSDPRYRDFMKRFIQRHEDLRLSGEYPDLNELMDD